MEEVLQKFQNEINELKEQVEYLRELVKTKSSENPSPEANKDNSLHNEQEAFLQYISKAMREKGMDQRTIERKITGFKDYAKRMKDDVSKEDIELRNTCADALKKRAENNQSKMAIYIGMAVKDGKDLDSSGWFDTQNRFLDIDLKTASDFFSLFASEQRIALLQNLVCGDKSATELQEKTGIAAGGQFYHHLRELASAKLLVKTKRGTYGLSSLGKQLVPIVLSLGWAVTGIKTSPLSELLPYLGEELPLDPSQIEDQ